MADQLADISFDDLIPQKPYEPAPGNDANALNRMSMGAIGHASPAQPDPSNGARAENWMMTGTMGRADPTQLGKPSYYDDLPELERNQSPKDRTVSVLSNPLNALPYIRAGVEAHNRGESFWGGTPQYKRELEALQQYYNEAYENAPDSVKVLSQIGLPGGPMVQAGKALMSTGRPIASAMALGGAQAGLSGYLAPIGPEPGDWQTRGLSALEAIPYGVAFGAIPGVAAHIGQHLATPQVSTPEQIAAFQRAMPEAPVNPFSENARAADAIRNTGTLLPGPDTAAPATPPRAEPPSPGAGEREAQKTSQGLSGQYPLSALDSNSQTAEAAKQEVLHLTNLESAMRKMRDQGSNLFPAEEIEKVRQQREEATKRYDDAIAGNPHMVREPQPVSRAATGQPPQPDVSHVSESGGGSPLATGRPITLSPEEYSGLPPQEAQHFREFPFENEHSWSEPEWHNPTDILKELIHRENSLDRYSGPPAVINRWRDELGTINGIWNTLPADVRRSAEEHMRANWEQHLRYSPVRWRSEAAKEAASWRPAAPASPPAQTGRPLPNDAGGNETNRLQSTAAQQAYGDPDLIPRLLNSPDAETRGIGAALRTVAGDFGRLKEGVSNGAIDPSWSTLASRLPEAARLVADLREQGIVPSEYVAQHGPSLHPHVAEWIDLLHHPAWQGEDAQKNTQWKLQTFLREPLGKEGSAGNIAPASPKEGFKAGVQTLHRTWARAADERDAQIPGWNLSQRIGSRLRDQPSARDVDPEWMQQARAYDPRERHYADLALEAGRSYDLDPHAHDTAVKIMRAQLENRMPAGVKIGVLRRVEPSLDPGMVRGLITDAPDFTNYFGRDFVTDGAAMWDPSTRSVILARYGTSGFKSIEDFSHGVESEAIHELGHAVSALHLSHPERSVLINDADRLGILNLPFNLYSGLRLGELRPGFTNTRPLQDMYQDLYKNRPNWERNHLMDEEAIAVLAELYHSGVVDPKELSSASCDILKKIVNGGYAR
jgi:hypothetical protein